MGGGADPSSPSFEGYGWPKGLALDEFFGHEEITEIIEYDSTIDHYDIVVFIVCLYNLICCLSLALKPYEGHQLL